jgi:catechol 2,3-dioxygenase-like lactoylglutathione lyase family enzyme
MGIKALDHWLITTGDMERTLAFYRGLGLEVLSEHGTGGAQSRPVIRINDYQKINILPRAPGAGPVPGGHFCLVWEGTVQGALELLERRGIPVEIGPVTRTCAWGPATSVYFRDPDGIQVEFAVYGE